MIDDRTEHLNLPLPHPDNLLKNDVVRIKESFIALDSTIHAQEQSTEDSLDLVIDVVDAQYADLEKRLHKMRLNQLLGLDI